MATPNSFDKLIPLFIKQLRGSISQSDLSSQLGYKFNIVNRWETEKRVFYWNDFVLLTKTLGLDLGKALEATTHIDFEHEFGQRSVMQHWEDSSVKKLLDIFPRQRIQRLTRGSTKLKFIDFLIFIEAIYSRANRFLGFFVEIEKIQKFRELLEPSESYIELIGKSSFLFILKQCLELQDYIDDPEDGISVLVEHLKAAEDEIYRGLRVLEGAKTIERYGNKYRKTQKSLDVGYRDKSASVHLSQGFRKEIFDSVENGKSNKELSQTAFLVYPSNKNLDRKVFELSRKYYIDLKNLVDSNGDEPFDRVQLTLIELFRLAGVKSSSL
ncbi:MAG: hypothetical protein CL676_07185 [Bdellovibrionaceae bacterium]|nr:hypothetical protein [Pseudobdellovibrionaceae bacterium]|tara:strand:+ start:582 stop:1559 length:978 start_codon:yes stop_codon:yes gene_type:complete